MAKRVVANGLTIPDVTSVDWDNPLEFDLLQCSEAQDENAESDDTSIASVPLYSRIKSMRLDMKVIGPSSSAVVHRWMLIKRPDGETLVTNATALVGNNFHSSDDSTAQREWRKHVLAKGILITNSSTGVTPLHVNVRPSAWARNSPMRENDLITLLIAKDATGVASTLHGFGTIWVKAHG